MTYVIRGPVKFFLRMACATVWRLCIRRDLPSDKTFTFGPIATCSDSFCRIRNLHSHLDEWNHSGTNSMFSIFFFTFAFVICICITHKWNLSLKCHTNTKHATERSGESNKKAGNPVWVTRCHGFTLQGATKRLKGP